MKKPGTTSRRPVDDDRRERILNAAYAALMERGYAGTSTLDIATRAKVSKRELYQFFADKQAIVTACIAARADRMRRPLKLPEARDPHTLAAILMTFGSTFLREVSNPAVVNLYRLAVIEAERSPEVAQALNTAGRDANFTALRDLLGRAQAAGLLQSGDPAAMASQFFALLWGDLLMRQVLRVAGPPSPEEIDRRTKLATGTLLKLHGRPASPEPAEAAGLNDPAPQPDSTKGRPS